MARRPEIAFSCRACGQETTMGAGGESACAACGARNTLDLPGALRDGGSIEVCPACDSRQLYVQRDFNQRAGLAVVVVGALLAPFTPFYSSLIVAALIDAGLYAMLPEITVCYRCHAHFRGFVRNPSHQSFDLHTAEQYDVRPPS